MMFNVLLDGFVSSGVKCFIGVNFYMVYYCNAAYLLLLHILAFFLQRAGFCLAHSPDFGPCLVVNGCFGLCLMSPGLRLIPCLPRSWYGRVAAFHEKYLQIVIANFVDFLLFCSLGNLLDAGLTKKVQK